MESKETYSRDDLLAAWLTSDGARDSHPDVADYYYRRVWALARAFHGWGPGFRFTRTPKEHRMLWTVFERSVQNHNENGFDPDTPAPDFDLYW